MTIQPGPAARDAGAVHVRAALVELVERKHPELVAANLDALDAGARHAAATASWR
jgi:hypothetical protein